MNALILSAIFGVIMMFAGAFLLKGRPVRTLGIAGMAILLVVTVLEMQGTVFFEIDTRGMMAFDRFGLLFNSIIFFSTLVFSFSRAGIWREWASTTRNTSR